VVRGVAKHVSFCHAGVWWRVRRLHKVGVVTKNESIYKQSYHVIAGSSCKFLPPTNSFYYIRSLGKLYLIQNPSHPTNLESTSSPSTPITPSLLPLPNSPEPNPELQTCSPSATSDFSHHATQIHAISPSATAAPTPRLKHPTRVVTSIQALSSSQVARRGASRLGRLRGEGSASTSASANSDVRRTTKVSLSQVSFRVRTF